MHQNSAVSKALFISLYKVLYISDHKYRFLILKMIVFLEDIGYLVKLLSNPQAKQRPKNLENKQL